MHICRSAGCILRSRPKNVQIISSKTTHPVAINIDQTLQCCLVSHHRRPTSSLHETNAIGSAKPPIYSSHASLWSICDGNSRPFSVTRCPPPSPVLSTFSLLGDHPRRAAAGTLEVRGCTYYLHRKGANEPLSSDGH